MRGVSTTTQVEVGPRCASPSSPNLSPPDTELYKALADALRRRAPGTVVAPDDPGGLHRQLDVPRAAACTPTAGAPSCWTPRVARVHGNDERISLDNIRDGVRAYTEMLLTVAAA